MVDILTLEDFTGGLSKLEETKIKDNQFSVLNNMYYNEERKIETRRGITTFGKYIPDAVTAVNLCNATTDFAVSNDATTLGTGTAIRGSNSVQFNIDVSNSVEDKATLTRTGGSTVDISSTKGYLGFWLFVPAAFNTNLTDVKVRIGSDSSNYYEWTLSTLTENSNNYIVLDYSDASTTGTPVDTAIDYFRLEVSYSSSYIDKTGVKIDYIYSYSATGSEPVTSYFFRQHTTTLERFAMVASGTSMFLYNENTTYWEVINTGLTKFETATGKTTHRTRWSFMKYLNIIYMCNGVDNYRSWNGTTITEYAGQPKFRYLEYMQDILFGAGVDAAPSTLYYTAALPADGSTIDANSITIGGEELGVINGMRELGNIILIFKDKKTYSVDIATPSVSRIDSQNGGYADRTISNVGNSLVYYNSAGLDTLKQRNGVSGSSALETRPLSQDVKKLTDKIEEVQYNSGAGLYIPSITNYYFSYDSNNDNKPDSTLIYSSLTGTWSEYLYPGAYQYGIYLSSDLSIKYLLASSSGGQLFEIETGLDDNGVDIPYELITKDFDLGKPAQYKNFQFVELVGFKSKGENITVSIEVDDENVVSSTITDSYLSDTSSFKSLGTVKIGTQPLAGSSSDELLETFQYVIRIPMYVSGNRIRINMESDSGPIIWTLEKMRIGKDDEVFDVFPTANYG